MWVNATVQGAGQFLSTSDYYLNEGGKIQRLGYKCMICNIPSSCYTKYHHDKAFPTELSLLNISNSFVIIYIYIYILYIRYPLVYLTLCILD